VEDGLPVNSVNDIAQTEDGYLWLATFDGLVRFDGLEFMAYRSAQYDGLPSNRILKLLVRPDGIWMVTESLNIVRFRNGTFTTMAEDVDLLHEGENGTLWTGSDDGVLAYRNGTFQPVMPTEIQGDVRELLVKDDGTLWVGTISRGLYRRTPGGRVQHLTEGGELAGQYVWSLAEDRKDRVWIGVKGGLHRWQDGQLVDIPVEGMVPGSVDVLHVDPDVGSTCLAAAEQGIFRCKDDRLVPILRKELSPTSYAHGVARVGPDGRVWMNAGTKMYRGQASVLAPETAVQRLFFDREGNAWIGTAGSGLFRLRPSPFTIYGEPEGLASSNIYPIEQRRNGSVWVGTLGGGLSRIDSSGVTNYRLQKGANTFDNVWTLHEDRSGRLLIGGGGQLCEFRDEGCARPNTESPIQARLRALYEDSRGRLWAGSEGRGLYRCDSACLTTSGAWTQFVPNNSDLPHPYVRTIHESPDGTLWFGTNGGGIVRRESGTFTPLTTAEGLSSNLVRDIYQDTTDAGTPNVLWVVTEDQGLNRVKLSLSDTTLAASITTYQERDGLYDNAVHQILKDGRGRFWLSSNRGLFWVRKAELEAFARGEIDRIQSTSYTTKEGLRSREANGGIQPAGLRAQDGRLWFPTQEGATVIDPPTIPIDAAPPPVHIETVTSGDSIVARRPEGPLRLAAPQRDFDIGYTGIRLANPEGVEFRYRLQGLQRDWQDAGERRQTFFTNVPPGQYTFQVAAQVRKGRWSASPAQLTVVVAPYFYETWWFYGLCVVALGLIGYGGLRYRLYAFRQRQRRLEEKVAERTRELRQANSQLEEAREEALAAAKARSQFLANMSHEIRTPMNGIVGFANLLADTELTPEQKEFVAAIQNSGNALLSIIDDILDFSKLEAGAMRLEDRPFRLQACVEEALSSLARNAAEKGLEMTYLIDPDVPPVIQGDETRLRQVLLNLLSNAVKFTEEGEVVLRVRVASAPTDGETPFTLHVSVRDTGIGIPEGKQDRLFESFTQADASTTREHGGTGLGLSISHQIVSAMDGEMWVESEEGEGSTFHFTMEARDGELPEDELRLHAQCSALTGRHAVVVDDNQTSRALLTQLLERWGMEAKTVASGAEALEHVVGERPACDVMLVDEEMPELGGPALLKKIRETYGEEAPPTLMLSFPSQHEEASGDVTPAARVHKPVRQSSLQEEVIRIVGDEGEPAGDDEEKSGEEEASEAPSERVLLAEDDGVNQKMISTLLDEMGHKTDIAPNGIEALRALREETYDLVLMDVQMPEMDGLEATRRIRSEWPPEEQPYVIALTAAVTEEDRERCKEAGMDAFLSKPVQQEDLTEALDVGENSGAQE